MQVIYPSGIPSVDVGGRIITDTKNLVILRFKASSGKISSAGNDGGLLGYAVPTGKTLRIVGIEISAYLSISASNEIAVGYGDASVGIDSASLPANPVYLAGDPQCTPLILAQTFKLQYPSNFPVPATKVPFIKNAGTGTVYVSMYGILE